VYVSEVSFSTVWIASLNGDPSRQIVTVCRPAEKARARAASAYAVSPVCVMTTTPSCGPTIGAFFTNCIEDTECADRPASWSMAAPRLAACWLVPVPTTQIRRTRWRASAAAWTCALTEPDVRTCSSCSGCERICCSSCVAYRDNREAPRGSGAGSLADFRGA